MFQLVDKMTITTTQTIVTRNPHAKQLVTRASNTDEKSNSYRVKWIATRYLEIHRVL